MLEDDQMNGRGVEGVMIEAKDNTLGLSVKAETYLFNTHFLLSVSFHFHGPGSVELHRPP